MKLDITELTIDHYDAVIGLWRSCEGVGGLGVPQGHIGDFQNHRDRRRHYRLSA
jgi:hypothetical protein